MAPFIMIHTVTRVTVERVPDIEQPGHSCVLQRREQAPVRACSCAPKLQAQATHVRNREAISETGS